MPIQDDINQILHAQSGEAVRGAIVNAIQDLNQNGGNAQTLNDHYSDEFTKNAEFQKFIDEEVGQVHVVLDAINKGITLRVIELGTKWIGPEAGTVLIEVPESVKDRQLLTVDDFYADIVEVASGTGSNAHWEKTDYYDTSDCTYTYSHGALASAIKLHFYAKRASATAVQDYNVHEFPDVVDMNATYEAPAGEAYNRFTVNVDVPVLQPEKIVSLSSSETITPDPNYDAMESVQVNIESPSLEQGGVVVNQATYDQTFTPTSPNIGFSEFRVQANVQFNTEPKEVRISDAEFQDMTVVPGSSYAGLSQVSIVNDMQLEEVTVSQNGIVEPTSGYAALKKVSVAVPVPVVETGRSVTYSSGGTYTVNPTGNNDAMDSVEVTVQTARLQSSKSVTLSQSGTVTPDSGYDAMEEVVVTVSGGGGGDCYICTQAEWDAMSMATKKSKGLTVIRDSDALTTGYWMDFSRMTVDTVAEFYGAESQTVSLAIQRYNHLIYFQSKWKQGGNADNGTISHTNISYDSMTTGTETIQNHIITPLTNYMTAILHDVLVGDNASITLSNGYWGCIDNALVVGIQFNSEVEIIAEHFSASAEQIVTAKDYDYILFMAGKWAYGAASSNGTYAISAGTIKQAGSMIIEIDGQDKTAIALYANKPGKIPSGTVITLGNRTSGCQDSVVAIGINEITS